eukprot:c1416_g1_i1.p1 GENE.c1416_g1_i1~~c1416_g1_i1.p1  ORF type:complete len:229 (-),score=60.85 c1416_g1_i1:23-709(-)
MGGLDIYSVVQDHKAEMFGGLRALLNKVEQRFEQQTTKPSTTPEDQTTPTPAPEKPVSEELFVPGAGLLAHFEGKWTLIHSNNTKILSRINDTEVTLFQPLVFQCRTQETRHEQLHSQLLDMANITEQVDAITYRMQAIITDSMELEQALTLITRMQADTEVEVQAKKNTEALLRYETTRRNDLNRLYENSSAKKRSSSRKDPLGQKRLEDVMLDTVEDQDLQAFYAE